MKEVYGNIFSKAFLKFGDAFCITTNGFTKKDGSCVMGAGVAKLAKETFPGLDSELGKLIKENGNRVQIIRKIIVDGKEKHLIAFPTKHNWYEKSDIKLIDTSAHQLITLTNKIKYKKVILPRPGCKNGQLNWKQDVKPLLEKILTDTYFIIYFK